MKFRIKEYLELKKYVETLSVDELLDIICQPNYTVDQNIDNNLAQTVFIHPNEFEKVKTLVTKFRKENRQLLITTDMEAGSGTALVGTTNFPSMRAVKETGNPELAYLMGLSAAKYAKLAGINWSFAPCVDVLFNHQSPITSLRSASEDVDEVITYTSNYLKGMQEHGLMGTLKHFPGEGITKYDQHLTTAINPFNKEEWDKTYRKVYTSLINEGAASVMVAHISLGCYDEIDPRYGIYPPASLSYNLITNLLIKDLGFEGIIISDAVNMGGFCGYMNFYEACKTFLNAGGDVLLFAHHDEQFNSKMKEFISDGSLTIELLRKRAYKILSFIKMYYETKFKEIPNFDDAKVADEIVKKSVKIYRDRNHILPISKKNDLKIAHLIFGNQYDLKEAQRLTKKLRQECIVDEFIDLGPFKNKEISKNKSYDYIICSTGCHSNYGTNQILLSGAVARNMMGGWTKNEVPVIFIDSGNPYLHEEYDAIIDAIIYTYGIGDKTTDVLVDVLFDKRRNK